MNVLILAATSWYLFVNGEAMSRLSGNTPVSTALTLEECIAWRKEVNRQTASQAVRAYCLPVDGSMDDLKELRRH